MNKAKQVKLQSKKGKCCEVPGQDTHNTSEYESIGWTCNEIKVTGGKIFQIKEKG